MGVGDDAGTCELITSIASDVLGWVSVGCCDCGGPLSSEASAVIVTPLTAVAAVRSGAAVSTGVCEVSGE